MKRDYYKILLTGGSGKGKTYSMRNLNPDTTGVINIEDKPLPFKNKFKYHSRPKTINNVKSVLKEYAENNEIDCIFIDSLSEYLNLLLAHARTTKRGYDVWNLYNEEVGKFLSFIKSIEKEVFITAHYEWIQDEGGAKEKRVKTKGKEWEGVIEKEFTIVLYADSKFEDKIPKFFFTLTSEDSSAKCPPDIFGNGVYSIENDCDKILEAIKEFVK